MTISVTRHSHKLSWIKSKEHPVRKTTFFWTMKLGHSNMLQTSPRRATKAGRLIRLLIIWLVNGTWTGTAATATLKLCKRSRELRKTINLFMMQTIAIDSLRKSRKWIEKWTENIRELFFMAGAMIALAMTVPHQTLQGRSIYYLIRDRVKAWWTCKITCESDPWKTENSNGLEIRSLLGATRLWTHILLWVRSVKRKIVMALTTYKQPHSTLAGIL